MVYRGTVRPPKFGKYRFVGAGDDILAIRFNRKNVFDFGYSVITENLSRAGKESIAQTLKSSSRRGLPSQWPLQMRQYPGVEHYNEALGGMAVGIDFQVQQNSTYPIEILISEIPGGSFSSILLIEENGANYEKTANGLPIIPIFRTNGELPDARKGLPPFDKNSPVWKISASPRISDL